MVVLLNFLSLLMWLVLATELNDNECRYIRIFRSYRLFSCHYIVDVPLCAQECLICNSCSIKTLH